MSRPWVIVHLAPFIRYRSLSRWHRCLGHLFAILRDYSQPQRCAFVSLSRQVQSCSALAHAVSAAAGCGPPRDRTLCSLPPLPPRLLTPTPAVHYTFFTRSTRSAKLVYRWKTATLTPLPSLSASYPLWAHCTTDTSISCEQRRRRTPKQSAHACSSITSDSGRAYLRTRTHHARSTRSYSLWLLSVVSAQLVSIFVNPTQFLPGEDLAAYPRPLQQDLALLTQSNVDYAFVPQPSEMYASPPFPPHAIYVDLVTANETAEGRVRPNHFRGVATVCTKLFNIVQPHNAYFGQKDGMQCVLLQRMVRELNMPLHIDVVSTSRESDGLARSSRNVYLTPEDRKVAPAIWKSLQEGQRAWDTGVLEVDELKRRVGEVLEREGGGRLTVQYVSVMSWLIGEELHSRIGETAGALDAGGVGVGSGERGVEVARNLPHSQVLLSVAAKVGKTRLIDNILLGPKVREAKEYVA